MIKKKAASTSAAQAEVTGGHADSTMPVASDIIVLPAATMVQASQIASDPSPEVAIPETEPTAQGVKEKKKKKSSADPLSEPEAERTRKRIKITKTDKEK